MTKMAMKYPVYHVYEELYKRYFTRSVVELIKLADIKPSDIVLDLCGGNGRLTKELTSYSKHVSYLDQEKDMIPDDLLSYGITVNNMSVQKFIRTTDQQFDKVFCQQAINYWLLHTNTKKFSELIKKNGIFVFNTFSNQPTTQPMVKEYEIDRNKYIEISYLVSGIVYHVQICEGYEPHFTVFDWIDPATFSKLLSPYFDIKVKDDSKTSLYICRRK
jgi:ubiquinone/menaquinone biosynthesis C-methylase UbiE